MINTTKEEMVNSSFLLVIENKKGKLFGLSATLNEEGSVDLYGIATRGYKVIKTIKKEALIDNNRVKAIYGNTIVAEEMRDMINKDSLDKTQVVEMAKNIQGNNLLYDISTEIEEVF